MLGRLAGLAGLAGGSASLAIMLTVYKAADLGSIRILQGWLAGHLVQVSLVPQFPWVGALGVGGAIGFY